MLTGFETETQYLLHTMSTVCQASSDGTYALQTYVSIRTTARSQKRNPILFPRKIKSKKKTGLNGRPKERDKKGRNEK